MKPSSKSYSRKARRARNKKFTSRGYKRAPRDPRARKGKFVYHDYVTYVTIPEHVGTRSVMISMNDIICPEVNFNSAFVLPGSRHWKKNDTEVLGDETTPGVVIRKQPIYDSKNKNALHSVRDYKFLVRTKDQNFGTHTEIPINLDRAEIDTKEDEGNELNSSILTGKNFVDSIRASGPRKRGTMNRMIRGNGVCQNISSNPQINTTGVGTSGETRMVHKYNQYSHEMPKVNNCAILGTICKGNYFIPRNGAAEYYLKRCVPATVRNEKGTPSVTSFVSPSGDIKFYACHSKTGVHDAYIELYGFNAKDYQTHLNTGRPHMNSDSGTVSGSDYNFESSILKNLYDRGIYEVGDTRFFGLSFRPCGLPSYVPHLQEVLDGMVCNTEFALYDRSRLADGSDMDGSTNNNNEFSVTDTKARNFNLWKNLSQRNLCEMMRVLQMTDEEMYELKRDGTANLAEATGRIGMHGNTAFFGQHSTESRIDHLNKARTGFSNNEQNTELGDYGAPVTHNMAGNQLSDDRAGPDIVPQAGHPDGMVTRMKKVFEEGVIFKKCVKSAQGVEEMRRIYDHHLVLGSKIDVQLIETSMSEYIKIQSKRGILTSNAGQVETSNRSDMPPGREFLTSGNQIERLQGEIPDVNCLWGIQKCYPEDHKDFGIPSSINQSPDTHECLPSQKEVDDNAEWCSLTRNRSVAETWNQIMKHDRHSSVRKDMFKLKGHYVEACSLRGKKKLSSKYDFNSSIKRYHDFNELGQVEYKTIPLKKDERFVVNHRIETRVVPDGKGGFVQQSGEDIVKKRAKRYDMRLKYMPCFRIFTKRAMPRMHNYAFTQMKLSTEDIPMDSMVINRMTSNTLDYTSMHRKSLRQVLAQQAVWADARSLGTIETLRKDANTATSNEFIDGCRIGEVVPQNPFVFVKQGVDAVETSVNHNGRNRFVSVPLQDGIYVEGGADRITPWEGTIDADAKEMIENFRTPAMRFKVRVRYKVWWWNDEDSTVLRPKIDDYTMKDIDCLNGTDFVIPETVVGDVNEDVQGLDGVTVPQVRQTIRNHNLRGAKRKAPVGETQNKKRARKDYESIIGEMPSSNTNVADNRGWIEKNLQRLKTILDYLETKQDLMEDVAGQGQRIKTLTERARKSTNDFLLGSNDILTCPDSDVMSYRKIFDTIISSGLVGQLLLKGFQSYTGM